jgi:uncharacterized protein YlxW (UPF0749 family)
MISIFHPMVMCVALIVVSGAYALGHHYGWDQRDMEMKVEIARKNDEARQTEQKLNEQINQTATKLQEANDAVTKKQTDLDRAIRAGRVRLPAPSCVSTASSPAPAPGDRNQAGSQPAGPSDQPSDAERATLAAIAEIVAQGQRNTEQLNACIDAYNNVREQLNGKR